MLKMEHVESAGSKAGGYMISAIETDVSNPISRVVRGEGDGDRQQGRRGDQHQRDAADEGSGGHGGSCPVRSAPGYKASAMPRRGVSLTIGF
jgi:hypothetical protein